ncbi:MAG: protein of unknown function DUF218 [Candidatus Micrarchaeum acidiphilum ARMAN-2]|uniref:DUF218 domain-containing protein n=1 Tax=Candidatus Micrarchaeum acidiphilum ARMAN-2 TaxID=425595 RepID=C7DGZ5_MICA2|nr:MAG: protein of unknown function DUF218 [Candidatus Micrarchaeum acidiphilum ARMAN-2]
MGQHRKDNGQHKTAFPGRCPDREDILCKRQDSVEDKIAVHGRCRCVRIVKSKIDYSMARKLFVRKEEMQYRGNTIIVALGKEISQGGSLTCESKKIVEHAVLLLKEGRAKAILFSGGWSFKHRRKPRLTESEGMRRYAVSLGAPASALITEKRSMDTIGNALYSSKIIRKMRGTKRILLVAVAYHMPRASYIFRKALGSRYVVIESPAESCLSKAELERARRKEAKSLALVVSLYKNVKNSEFEATVKRNHPLYGTDPSTIPSQIWEYFNRAGFSKKYIISRFMKASPSHKAKKF